MEGMEGKEGGGGGEREWMIKIFFRHWLLLLAFLRGFGCLS